MIIQKSYAIGAVVCFKLVNGDEIVAKLVAETFDYYVIDRPYTVVPSQQGLGLIQSLFCGDINNNNITLNKQFVIMHVPPIKDMVNHYIHTTTGIQPVSNGIII